jgi:predicted dehydrogenase
MSIRLGQIALGRFATGHHLKNLFALGDSARLVAVCDVSQEALDRRDERLADCETFTKYEDLIDPDRVDGIIVSTPNSHHFGPCKLAMERGVPVLVDKPLTMTVREGEELVALSRDCGVPLVTAFTRHFMPAAEYVRQQLRASDDVAVISAVQRGGRTGERPEDGGILHRRSVHVLDVIPWLAGSPVVAVEGFTVAAERVGHAIVDARLHLASGVLGRVLCVQDSDQTEDEVSVYGSSASYRLNKQSVLAAQKRGEWTAIDDLPEAGGNVTTWFVELLAGRLSSEAQKRADLHSEDGLQALRVLEAILEADRTGSRVELKP